MKNGFTLMELLAVIVILGIIALVGTPIVLSTIESVNKNSAITAMRNIEKAVNLYYTDNKLNKIEENIVFECSKGECKNGDNILKLEGKTPEEGKIYLDKKGNVVFENTVIDGYNCYKESEDYVCDKDKTKNIFYESSIILNTSKKSELLNYSIYGNSILQDNSFIEKSSVGQKSRNMADLSKVVPSTTTTHVKFDYDNLTGTLEYTSKPTRYDYLLLYLEKDLGCKFEIGKTYYWGADITVSGKKTTDKTILYFGLAYDNSPLTGRQIVVYENQTFKATGNLIYDGTQKNIRLVLHANYGSFDPGKIKFENLYVSEVDEFEPVGKYKIPIEISGKNKWVNNIKTSTINGITCVRNEDGSLTFNGTATGVAKFNFSENNEVIKAGTYTISGIGNDSTSPYNAIVIVDYGNPTTSDQRTITISSDRTVTAANSFIRFSQGTVLNNYTINPQLEIGSTATQYEPYRQLTTNIYLDEPLRKIGDYVDYIDFKNQKVIRYIEKLEDGTLKVLNYPKEQDIELPSILLEEGFNNISIDTDVSPSKVEFEYYK